MSFNNRRIERETTTEVPDEHKSVLGGVSNLIFVLAIAVAPGMMLRAKLSCTDRRFLRIVSVYGWSSR